MRSLLIVVGIVVVVGGPFWFGSRVHARGVVPTEFQRPLPPEVLQWEVNLGTAEQPIKALGPLRVGGSVAQSEIDKLGTPEFRPDKSLGSAQPYAHADRKNSGPVDYALYGNGLFLVGNEVSVYGDKQFRVLKIVLGNPWAMSAEDPLVKACQFKMPNGIAFGMGIEEVERRLKELAPTHGELVPRTYRDGYAHFGTRVGGMMVKIPCGEFHYMNDQLVALVFQ